MITVLSALLLASNAAHTTVVAPLKAVGVPANDVAILTAELRTQIGRSSSHRLVTPEEMDAVSEELERQLSGGCDDASCVAELGGALGAKYLISGQVGKLGSLYTLQLKLIDIETVAAKRTASAHAAKIESLLIKLPELTRDLLGEQASKRQAVLNATAKVANKVLEQVAKKRAAKPEPTPAPAPPKGLFASEPMGITLLQGVYRPPNAALMRAAIRLGSRVIVGASTGWRPENEHTTTLTEFDAEVALIGSQKSGGRFGATWLRRSWRWGEDTGSDLGIGAIIGYRHVLSSKLVFDISLAAGFVSKEVQDNNGPRSQTGFDLISGGLGLGWSPF